MKRVAVNTRIGFAGFLLPWLTVAVSGQTTPLTLDDCVRLALRAPSQVMVGRQEQRIAAYGITIAKSGFLPQMQVGNGFTYNSPPRTGSSGLGVNPQSFVALNGMREYQSALGTALEIDTSGRLRAELARARADQRIAAADVAILQRDLKRAVTAAFYRVLLARRLITANRDVLAEAESFAERTRALFKAGEVAQADVVKADAQLAFLAQTLRAAELDAQTANADLASFWTADVSTGLALMDLLESPPPPDSAAPDATAFLRRPEFLRFDAERVGFEADARRERAALLPQLTVNYQFGLDANRLAWDDRGQAAFVAFNIPVFDWLRARSLADQFRVRAEQVETRREITTREFSRDYQNALARTRLLYEQIAIAEAQVKTSRDNVKLSRVRYEGGEGPALEVVAAQSQLAQAQTNYYTALANYAASRAELEVASGK